MATDLERLIVSLEASTVKYERALARANGITNQRMNSIERRTSSAAKNISNAFGSALTKGFALAGGGAALVGAKNLIDSSIKIENSLKVAGLAGEELSRVYDKLFESAQRNAAPLEALATLYGRVAQVQKELGIGTEELVNFTDKIAVALRVSGRTAEESRGALLQLGQALGGTIVRAEEFNSINEGALPVLQAVANGLEEAGGSVAKLRTLVINGEVSSKAFFRAFEAGSVSLENKVKDVDVTIDQSFTRFINLLTDLTGQFNKNTGLAKAFSEQLGILGDEVQDLAGWFLDDALPAITAFINQMQHGVDVAKQLAEGFSSLTGLDKFGFDAAVAINNLGIDPSILSATSSGAGKILTRTFELIGRTPQDEALAAALTGDGRVSDKGTSADVLKFRAADYASVKAIVKPVSLKDFPVGDDDADAKKAEKARQKVKDYIADLEFEKSLIGLTEIEQKKLTAAREAGAAATDKQREYIKDLTEEIYLEQEAAKYLKDLYDELGNVAQGAIEGIIGALEDGKITTQEFGDILADVLGQLGQFFLSQAFGSGTNGFSSILQGIFGGGRASGGPVEAGKVYKVNENTPNSEYFAPSQDGMIIPRISKGSGGASSQGGNVFHIDARGAQRGVGEEIRAAIEQYDRYTLPGRVNRINKDPLARG